MCDRECFWAIGGRRSTPAPVHVCLCVFKSTMTSHTATVKVRARETARADEVTSRVDVFDMANDRAYYYAKSKLICVIYIMSGVQ